MDYIEKIYNGLKNIDYLSLLNIPLITINDTISVIINDISSMFSEKLITHNYIVMTKFYYHSIIFIKTNPLFIYCSNIFNQMKNYYDFIFSIQNTEDVIFKSSTYYLYGKENIFLFEHFIRHVFHKENIPEENEKQFYLSQNYLDSFNTKTEEKDILDTVIFINDNDPNDKLNKTYVYVCNDMNNNPDILNHRSNVKFLYIEYHNKITDEIVEIFLNHEYYINGNQLFSPAFVYKLLGNRLESKKFNMNYSIHLIDNNIKTIEIKNDEYVELNYHDYEIKKINEKTS